MNAAVLGVTLAAVALKVSISPLKRIVRMLSEVSVLSSGYRNNLDRLSATK